MIWACIFGYIAMAISFYLYITRTAEIEPDMEAELRTAGSSGAGLTIVAGGRDAAPTRKAA